MTDDEIIDRLADVPPGSLDDVFALTLLRGTYPLPEAREHWLQTVSKQKRSADCFTKSEL